MWVKNDFNDVSFMMFLCAYKITQAGNTYKMFSHLLFVTKGLTFGHILHTSLDFNLTCVIDATWNTKYSGVTGGGGGAEFLLTYQEKRVKEKGGKMETKSCRREGEKLKMEGGKVTRWQDE